MNLESAVSAIFGLFSLASNLYARGRVYKIVNDWQLLLANPPLQNLGSYKSESNGHDMTYFWRPNPFFFQV
jgi:hypothetical protein